MQLLILLAEALEGLVADQFPEDLLEVALQCLCNQRAERRSDTRARKHKRSEGARRRSESADVAPPLP